MRGMILRAKSASLIFIIVFFTPFICDADSSLSHNAGNIEMLISDWGAFTRIEGSEVSPGFNYSGRDYLDPFSEVWVSSSTGQVASAYDGTADGISIGEWLATTQSGGVEYIPDHPNASQVIHAQYAADRYNDFPYDITVDQYTYAWNSDVDPVGGDFIIMKLILTNQGVSPQEFSLAVQTNWDINYSEERDDLMDWDTHRRAGIAYDSDGTDPVHAGLALISGELASHNIVDVYEWEYQDSDRAELMGNGEIDDLETIGRIAGNYFSVISTKPYNMPPGDSVSVVYVFSAGQDRNELLRNIDAAERQAIVPGELVAEPSKEAVHLNWSASISPDIAAYKVYKSSISGGSYSEISQLASDEMNYRDGDVEIGSVYYYVVSAIGADGAESDYSNEVHTSPGVAPEAPYNLALTDDITPVLKWQIPDDKEIDSYVVYRNFTGSEPWTAISTVDSSIQTFVDQNVYEGDTYYYTVASVNGQGWSSEYSNVVSVTIDTGETILPAEDLTSVAVAPNPCIIQQNGSLRFVNLTENSKIDIYMTSGILIRTLYNTSGNGAAEWDLRNEMGNTAASGIYLYTVEAYRSGEMHKFTTSGKFALVR